ncbi:hypothetical protein Afil01_29510 [Actinorhabdospora filicis]|uniref:HTH luxR-type domain-containing protein n=1 Tax=Actinorhabdospora filicis TaxID=1785913 RepID=A0A9W6SLV3_9ACTN|nr:hypothetical protein Afil01_29510 [Actinorhabdospora filicis]
MTTENQATTREALRHAGSLATALLHAVSRHRMQAATGYLDAFLMVLKSLDVRPTTAKVSVSAGDSGLSERELEVLAGLSQGHSNAQIAARLFISEDTVKTHTRRLYRKLGASDRAHAVATAFRAGLLT